MAVGDRQAEQPAGVAVAGRRSRDTRGAAARHCRNSPCRRAESGYPAGRLAGWRAAAAWRCRGRSASSLHAAAQREQRQTRPQIVVVVADQAHRRGQQHRPSRSARPAPDAAATARRTQHPGDRREAAPPTRPASASARHSQLCGVVAPAGPRRPARSGRRENTNVTTIAFTPVEPTVPQRPGQRLCDRPSALRRRRAGCVMVGPRYSPGRMPVPAPSPDARAVVTGASQNIGEALATELAARGHHLIVTARREDVLTDAGRPAHRQLRRHRRGAAGGPRRPDRTRASWPTNWPAATSRSCAPTPVPRPSGRSPRWIRPARRPRCS